MKISDITQRSQVQHIAEGRKQLDEAFPAAALLPGGALALWLAAQGLTVADYYRLAQKNGTEGNPSYDPTDWDTDSQVELGITGAAGLAGGWFGKMVAKPLGWAVGGTMKLASPFFNKGVKQAGKKVKDAKDQLTQAKELRRNARGQDKQAAKDLEAEAKADLKQAKTNRANTRANVGSSTSTGIMRAGRIAGGIGTGAYALDKMGKSVGDLITGKGYEAMTDAEKKARDKAAAAAELKRKLRFSGPSSHRSGAGVIGQDQYDITSQQIKKYEKEYKAAENAAKEAEKEAAEAAEEVKAERQAKAEKQANQQDQSKEK